MPRWECRLDDFVGELSYFETDVLISLLERFQLFQVCRQICMVCYISALGSQILGGHYY